MQFVFIRRQPTMRDDVYKAILSRSKDSPENLKRLISAGADFNKTYDEGLSPLLLATSTHLYYNSNCLEKVKLLIENGADINAVDDGGKTALYFAIKYEHYNVIKYLIDQGIDINHRDDKGRTAIEFGVEISEYFDVSEGCKILLDNNVSPHSALKYMIKNLHYYQDLSEYEGGVHIEDAYGHSQDLASLFAERVVFLQCQGEPIGEMDLVTIQQHDDVAKHCSECRAKIDRMKEVKVHRDLSVHKLFFSGKSAMTGSCRDSEIVEAAGRIEETEFPIYYCASKTQLDIQVTRQSTHKSVATFISKIFGFNDIFHLVTRRVMDFLDYKDAKKLGKALAEESVKNSAKVCDESLKRERDIDDSEEASESESKKQRK